MPCPRPRAARAIASASGSARTDEVRVFTVTRIPGVDEAPLITDLEKHQGRVHRSYRDRRSCRDLFFGWIIPLGVMVGIWMFLMRRRGRRPHPGPLVRALEAQDLRPQGAQDDVQRRRRGRRGQGRARRDRRLPEEPEEVPAPRRSHPEGRAPGRAPGHGQDPAGAGGGRRGRRAVLHPVRLGVRRDVRRRGRRARPRPLRAGQGQGALHHLHRRAGRDRQVAGGQHRASSAATTSASRP